MSPECADLDLFFDGELPAEAAAAFQAHLAGCDRCQGVLRGRMQEEVIAEAADQRAAQPAAPMAAGKPRRILYLTPILAAAAAVVIWVGARATEPAEPIELSLAVDHPGAATRSGTAHVGDVVRPVVRGPGHRALWVYLGERELVVVCPGGAGCGGDEHELTLELPLRAPGSYSIIAVVSAQLIAQPQGAVDVMLSAVTSAGARVKITHVEVN